METAPFIKRFIAAIIDYLVLVLIALAIAAIFGLNFKLAPFIRFVKVQQDPLTQALLSVYTPGPALIFLVVYLAYFIIMEAARSATLGKILMGLTIVKEDGARIGLREALLRTLFRGIDATPFYFVPLYIVGLISYLCSPSRQRLGDHVAQTLVVSRK